MKQSKLSKQMSDRIGRSFNLLYTRATMYQMDHPSANQALVEFYKMITEGLNILSPMVLIMNREQFFIEEESLDPRINTSKMVTHFKKSNIQSISFEKGLKDAELETFIRIFTDLKEYPSAESMKTALTKMGVINIKVNYVVYRKMTADEKVVTRDRLKESVSGTSKGTLTSMDALIEKMMAEGIIVEELEKSLSIKNLIENPKEFSKVLLATDISNSKKNRTDGSQPGILLSQQLQIIREKVEKVESAPGEVNLAELAESVFALRKELLKGLEAQKAMGVLFADEAKIRREADELTDQVLIQLVKEEYKKGKTSIPRLAQILRRLMPDTKELRRLLPKLKKALLAEGMSLSEFLQLIQEMGKEFQSEELVEIFQKSAEEIGLSSEDLIQEIKRDPTGAAELIFLAAEIRKGTGDEKVLSDLLVDYIERIGCEMALDTAEQKGEEGGKHLRDVISNVETELVDRLRKKNMNANVLSVVEQKLKERRENTTRQLKSSWIMRQFTSLSTADINKTTMLRALEKSVDDEDELQGVLKKVLPSLHDRGVDENMLQQIYDDILEREIDRKKEEKKDLPKGTFNRGTMLFFLKKELSRARRYKIPFSTITFSIVKATPKVPILPGSIKRNEIKNAVMMRLVKIVRDTDLVGSLDENKICALLSMTAEKGSRLAIRRILKVFHSEPFIIKDIPLEVKLAAVATVFHRDRTPTLQAFVKAIKIEMNELMKPVKSWFLLDKSKE